MSRDGDVWLIQVSMPTESNGWFSNLLCFCHILGQLHPGQSTQGYAILCLQWAASCYGELASLEQWYLFRTVAEIPTLNVRQSIHS